MPQADIQHAILFAVISILIWSLKDWFFIFILLLSPLATEIVQHNLGAGKFSLMDIFLDYLGILAAYCIVALWSEIRILRVTVSRKLRGTKRKKLLR